MTNEEIIQRGQLINDETEPAQNTSERVGGVIKGIGQNLAEKDTAIERLAKTLPRDIVSTWVQGGIATATGANTQTQARLRSEYYPVSEGDTICVNPKNHYVGIYLYNTDKTTALGAYAVTLTTGEYEYLCPQDGFVRFLESKVIDTSQNIIPSEQISKISIAPKSTYATKKELEDGLSIKIDFDVIATEIDYAKLPIHMGYPIAAGTWNVPSSGTRPYHKVIERVTEMKRFKIDSLAGNASRYVFMKEYSVPAHGDNWSVCDNQPVMNTIAAGNSSGWVEIPSDCKYIILIHSNAGTSYIPNIVSVAQDKTDYDVSKKKTLTSADFSQGGISTVNGSNTETTTRIRSGFYKVSLNDVIDFDFENQKVNIYIFNEQKVLQGVSGWWYKRKYTCIINGYVRFVAASMSGSGNIAPNDLLAKISIPNADNSDESKDEYNGKVQNVARPPRKGNVLKSAMLTLLTFSDIHLDRKDELQRILSFNDKYGSYLDDIISLGDLQDRGFESDIAVFRELADAGAKNVLQVIGNHDYYNSGANVWTYNSDANVYARFFAPFISNWGVANTSNTLYWYKDYTDNNTYTGTDAVPRKIRLIAINTNNNGSNVDKFDSTQQAWITSVLADAKTNGFSVIVASHYKPRMTYIDCNFSDKTLQLSNEENYANNAAATIIQEFIDGGGKFICWLCGHEHNDYVGVTSVTGTSQLVIGVSLAQCGVRVNYSVMDRVEGTKSQDLFNVIGFDTYNKHIRILRIGADMDIFMRSKKTLCINYETKQIVGQS